MVNRRLCSSMVSQVTRNSVQPHECPPLSLEEIISPQKIIPHAEKHSSYCMQGLKAFFTCLTPPMKTNILARTIKMSVTIILNLTGVA